MSYPLASTELAQEGYLDIGYNLSQQGIDIFNCDDPFYNDICFPFTGERERDITIEDRRIEYYPNFTLCENNCTYIGVNYTTNYSICLCDAKTDVIVERNDTTDEYHFKFSDALPKTNLLVVKCANTIFNTKLFYRNIGFWIQLILLVTITTLLIVFFAKRNTMIQSVIKKIIIYSKPTMNLLIITTLHSFAYIIYYYTETNLSVTNSPPCWIQSILLISSCQTQEVWLMIITFVCYQGIINRTFYNMQNDLSLFIVFVIMINFVYPLSLILIYYCSRGFASVGFG